MTRRAHRYRRFATAAVALAVAAVPLACGDEDRAADPSDVPDTAEEVSGYTRDPAPNVSEVSLPAASGEGRVAMAPESGLRIVYFGYTSCPDVCPTTMADLKRALASLPEEQSAQVSFVMVTVDPDRDVAEKMDAYVTTFLPDGLAARTEDDAELRSVADVFGADYSVTTDDDGEIEVSHTAELYAVDESGTVVLQWPFGTAPESLAADLGRLLDEGSPT